MSEMVERVAKAIAEAASESDVFFYPYEKRKEQMDAIARAAIEAMLEPAPDMVYAARFHGGVMSTYKTMIGAALK